jgi:hypothetical protein
MMKLENIIKTTNDREITLRYSRLGSVILRCYRICFSDLATSVLHQTDSEVWAFYSAALKAAQR